MNSSSFVPVSRHYKKRYSKRIANSSRIEKFATEALSSGKAINEVGDARYRRYLHNIEAKYNHSCIIRIYQGFVHIFDSLTMTAITVYRAPNNFRTI